MTLSLVSTTAAPATQMAVQHREAERVVERQRGDRSLVGVESAGTSRSMRRCSRRSARSAARTCGCRSCPEVPSSTREVGMRRRVLPRGSSRTSSPPGERRSRAVDVDAGLRRAVPRVPADRRASPDGSGRRARERGRPARARRRGARRHVRRGAHRRTSMALKRSLRQSRKTATSAGRRPRRRRSRADCSQTRRRSATCAASAHRSAPARRTGASPRSVIRPSTRRRRSPDR